jgi:glycosyltransferase involved in cell wall biosynthesis
MKILFVGVYANQEFIHKFNNLSSSDGSISIAAVKYTRLIADGLKLNVGDSSTNLFLVPIGMYPTCKVLIWNKTKIDDDYYIPFINVIFIKQLMICLYLFYFTIKWYFNNYKHEKKLVVFGFLYLPFLMAIAPLKLLNKLYFSSFVPDLPDYEFSYSKNNSFFLKQIFIPLYITISKTILRVIDFNIYITHYMKNYFGNKPYHIIEGFADVSLNTKDSKIIANKKALMYAGALFEKFGLRMLLEAFYGLEGDYELWLFGSGDMQEVINLYAHKDHRIKYFGNRPNDEIIEFEKKAKLLINPRFSNNEFTKYSFPSKLIEYMSSGTPVLTTKLPGIPCDYSDKMFYIQQETVKGFQDSILDCLSKSQDELDQFGNKAKTYVLENKNNFIQIKKLLTILDNIILK